MAHLGEISGFGLGLQGGGATPTATATLLELLTGSMNGSSDRLIPRKTFKVRLGFNGCCGATWGFGPSSNMGVIDDDHDDDDHAADLGDEQEEEGGGSPEVENVGQTTPENGSTPACTGNVPASSGMNLAAALAAERQLRETQELDGAVGFSPSLIRPSNNNNDSGVSAGTPTENRTPTRVSLMKLLAETDGRDDGETEKEGAGVDSVCCVCMGRKKGAAFIPCGHTFCRVCSRELWLNRGSCPLCNRSILEILDIF